MDNKNQNNKQLKVNREKSKKRNKKLMIIVAVAIFIIYVMYTNLEAITLKVQGDSPAIFEIIDNKAYINGVISKNTARDFEAVIANYPELTTVVFDFVPSSINDDATLKVCEMINSAKLNTLVPYNGLVAGNAVDIFLAGVSRTIESGAKIGVRARTINKTVVNNLAKSNNSHQRFLELYKKIGVCEEFYWFTVNAPVDKIKWLTDEEIKQYNLSTK
ncbi:hypothetical protein IMX26_06690 [Clostridium sp. 'deep sea']|uniref:hypothetical protein n=1 Tax=Clostridium sp. 'deep sea' TaxID=2779445 RepID=UPI0018964D3A|nr:hypothetical protein [Clostridium sp. 'deep sea']QOR36491.1 hypothetical protein IMX26_06690 [Clostridium sp. 'deep sea']